ncbi:MerR family transcriptional regulator [Ktedonosporobacter rubrisoli]|nr:MerR family transcriptional regulator [Ktedonosporobacter rubrisoli]
MKEDTILKIGEFARINQISVATLRYYDQWDLLKPAVLDPDTGYRYYSLEQLPRLNRILALKELGFPLEQIAVLIEEDLSLEQLHGMFMLKQAQTQHMIDVEQARLSRIAARLRYIEEEGKMPAYEILLKQAESIRVASLREFMPLQDGFKQNYHKIATYLAQHHVQPGRPALLLLYARSEQGEGGLYIDAETAIPLSTELPGNAQIRVHTLQEQLLACTVHTGANLFIGQAYIALYSWLKDNSYQLVGPPRQVYHRWEKDLSPEQQIIELQFPVAKQASSPHES